MSDLSEQVKREVQATTIAGASLLRQLCDEHERLEAEHEKLRGACATALAERDAFCSLTTQATRELGRLEGILREWYREVFEYDEAICVAEHALFDEAVRLAKATS